jgi:hypothetical protein
MSHNDNSEDKSVNNSNSSAFMITEKDSSSSNNSYNNKINQRSKTGSFYESQTLLCKNKCGYYGNSIQYDGYCSICYRKLKQQTSLSGISGTSTIPRSSTSALLSHTSFDDATSFIPHSQSFQTEADLSNQSSKTNLNDDSTRSNLTKISSKKKQQQETKRFRLFRRPPINTTLNDSNTNSPSTTQSVLETVSKAADRAVNKIDSSILQAISSAGVGSGSASGRDGTGSGFSSLANSLNNSLNNSSASLHSSPSSFSSNSNNIDTSADFLNCLNRLVSPSAASTSSSSSLHHHKQQINNSSKILTEFEGRFRHNFPLVYSDLSKQLKQFVEKFIDALKRKEFSIYSSSNRQFEVVQEFFKKIYNSISTNTSLANYLDKINNNNNNDNKDMNSSNDIDLSEKLYEALMIMSESYVTNSIYDYVFPTLMTEFEEQDISLQRRIRSFYWITNEMIGTTIDENSIFYKDFFEEAVNCNSSFKFFLIANPNYLNPNSDREKKLLQESINIFVVFQFF